MAQFVINIQNGTICDQYSKWLPDPIMQFDWFTIKVLQLKKKYSVVENFIWYVMKIKNQKIVTNARNILKGSNEEMVKI